MEENKNETQMTNSQIKFDKEEQQNNTQQPKISKEEGQLAGTVSHIQDHSFYFFINPTSGSNEGQLLLNLEKSEYNFQIPNKFNKHSTNNNKNLQHYNIYFRFINLMDSKQQELGTEHIKDEIRRGQRQIYAITCGGDGTVMWVAEVLDKFKINLQDIPIGIVALGTGNDFSRALGWGPTTDMKGLIKNNFKNMKKLALKWIQSNISDFDIWDSKVEVYEGGYFEVVKKIDGKATEQIIQDKEANQPLQVLNKTFSNYFSTGIDAQIGFGFDKKRTKSRICNLCVYTCQSIKYFCKKKYVVNNELKEIKQKQSIAGFDSEEDEQRKQLNQKLNPENPNNEDNQNLKKQNQLSEELDQVEIEQNNNKEEQKEQEQEEEFSQILTTRTQQSFHEHMQDVKKQKKEGNQEINTKTKYLNNGLTCLLILNINSYAAGATDIWKNSNKKGAILDYQGNKQDNFRKYKKQEFSDGKLEVLTYTNMVKLGLEKLSSGSADRTAQGSNFKFTFRESDKLGNNIVTYFQIDGEFYKVIRPKSIEICKSKKFNGQKYKVMVENKMFNHNLKQKDE